MCPEVSGLLLLCVGLGDCCDSRGGAISSNAGQSLAKIITSPTDRGQELSIAQPSASPLGRHDGARRGPAMGPALLGWRGAVKAFLQLTYPRAQPPVLGMGLNLKRSPGAHPGTEGCWKANLVAL